MYILSDELLFAAARKRWADALGDGDLEFDWILCGRCVFSLWPTLRTGEFWRIPLLLLWAKRDHEQRRTAVDSQDRFSVSRSEKESAAHLHFAATSAHVSWSELQDEHDPQDVSGYLVNHVHPV